MSMPGLNIQGSSSSWPLSFKHSNDWKSIIPYGRVISRPRSVYECSGYADACKLREEFGPCTIETSSYDPDSLRAYRKITNLEGYAKLKSLMLGLSAHDAYLGETIARDIKDCIETGTDIVLAESPKKAWRKFGGRTYEAHLWDTALILAKHNPLCQNPRDLGQLLLVSAMHDLLEDAPGARARNNAQAHNLIQNVEWLNASEKNEIIKCVEMLTVDTHNIPDAKRGEWKLSEFRKLCTAAQNMQNPEQLLAMQAVVIKLVDTVANSYNAADELQAVMEYGSRDAQNRTKVQLLGYTNRHVYFRKTIELLGKFGALSQEQEGACRDLLRNTKVFLAPVKNCLNQEMLTISFEPLQFQTAL